MGQTGNVSLSLATVLEKSLNMTSHNLANASTAGYKTVNPVFKSTAGGQANGAETVHFVQSTGTYLDTTQGSVFRTDNPLDIAVSGDGWLAFETDGGAPAYGRFGQLVLNADGQMVTAAGRPILDVNGGPITLPAEVGTNVTIAADGSVTDEQNNILGQIGVFQVPKAETLAPIGRGLYAAEDGEALAPAEEARVLQGYLEASNVEPVLEMTRLIDIQRAYEGSIKLMTEEDELTKQVIQRLGRRS